MSLKKLLGLYLLWQAVIIGVVFVAQFWLPLRPTFLGSGGWWTNFDGIHYIAIAQSGYGYAQQAFFPFYPNLIALLNKVTGSFAASAITISQISFAVALIFLVKLLNIDYHKNVVFMTILALLIFPTSYYFGAAYTEGLFLLFLVLSFYSARTGKWWLAGIFGALASYTRLAGVFLLPALLVEYYQQSKISNFKFQISNLFLPLIVPLGLGCYMWYLWNSTGDPLAFMHVQKLFGQGRSDNLVMLYQVFWRYVKMLWTVNKADPLYLTIIFESVTSLFFLLTTILSFKQIRLSYAVFSVLAYLVPTLTGNFASMPRYVLVCLSSFILFGQAMIKYPIFKWLYISICLFLTFVFLGLFARGYWVG